MCERLSVAFCMGLNSRRLGSRLVSGPALKTHSKISMRSLVGSFMKRLPRSLSSSCMISVVASGDSVSQYLSCSFVGGVRSSRRELVYL